MKAFFRKLARVKKRKAIKRAIAGGLAAWALKYGRINQTTDLFINSSQEIQSITAQKSELTYIQEELDALGLGKVNREVTLVVGIPMPHSSQYTLAVHEENWNRLIQESNIPINIEQEPKIVMSRTKSDLTNRKWIKEFISSIRGGGDEKLIKSILGKVAESELDVPSINKILERIADAILSVGSNEKLLKILGELEKPIKPSVLTVTPSTEVVSIPNNLQDYQHESRSSSSVFVEGFLPRLPRHRRQNEVEWKKENKCSTLSADSLLDSTKCYGHREAYDMPREVTERFKASAVSKLAKNSLKNPLLKKEYARVKKSIKQGIHPINVGYNSAFVSSDKVLIKCLKGRYLVEVGDTKVDIIGVVARGSDKSVKSFEKLMNKMYNLDLQY